MKKRNIPDFMGSKYYWNKKEVIGVVALAAVNVAATLFLMRKNYWDGVEDLFSEFEPVKK